MLTWVVFGLSVLNLILALIPNPNWPAIYGWLCSSIGWLAMAMEKISRAR